MDGQSDRQLHCAMRAPHFDRVKPTVLPMAVPHSLTGLHWQHARIATSTITKGPLFPSLLARHPTDWTRFPSMGYTVLYRVVGRG